MHVIGTFTLLLSACGTLEVRIDQSSQIQTAAPDQEAVATISALKTQNAHLSAKASSTSIPENLPLTLQSDPEVIRQKMLFSHRYWSQVWLDGEFIYYSTDGSTIAQKDHIQIWIDQLSSRFRVLIGSEGNPPQRLMVSNGLSVLQMDLQTGQSESYSLTPIPGDYPNPSIAISDTIEPHPIAGQLGTPLADALFPTGLAQRGGYYVPIDVETVAGHPTLVVDWYRFQPGERVDRFWLDIQTGVILRWHNYTKQGGETLYAEAKFNQIVYNPSFPEALFQIPPSTNPAFAQNASGTPIETPTPQATPQSSSLDTAGELYFTLLSSGNPNPSIRLVRLPGSCVIGTGACPTNGPETIPDYPNTNYTILPLIWSQDGQVAVVPYPSQESATLMSLYRFIPDNLSWSLLAEMSVIEQASWSPDGQWILFQGQEGTVLDLFAVHPDGIGLINLTNGNFAGDYDSFIMGGWLGKNEYLFAFGDPMEATFYQINPNDGLYKPFSMDFPPGKSQFLPSRDGKYIAVVDGPEVKIYDAKGEFVRQLASFQNTSVTLHAWSTDSLWILFNGNGPNSDDVYIANQDGNDFRQIYPGKTIVNPIFSPDAKFVIIEDSNDSGDRLYIYSLDTGTYKLLAVPGLDFADSWRAPSWRPIQAIP